MRAKVATLAPLVNGWQVPAETMGVYGNHYLKRATLAMVGLGSNPPEDAIYPLAFTDGDGHALDGNHDYLLRFDAQDLPSVGAFWSLTLYDQEGFQVPNTLNRSALGDRDPLRHGPDGSLELLIQHEDPGPEHGPNWLPSPRGPFALFLRLYEPRAQALDGTWKPLRHNESGHESGVVGTSGSNGFYQACLTGFVPVAAGRSALSGSDS